MELEIIKCMEVMEESYGTLKTLSKMGFMTFLGNLIDQYGADHNMTSQETCSMLEDLSMVQKQVHENLGMASAS